MAKWTREQTTMLLELYKQYPHLYDNRHFSYSDRNERQNTLLIIANELEKYRPKTTIRDLKQKIRTIRTQYCVEKHKCYKSQSKDLYSPRLWCYDSLKFLDGVTHYDSTRCKHPDDQCRTPALDRPVKQRKYNHFEDDRSTYQASIDTIVSKSQDVELIDATSQNSESHQHTMSDTSKMILPTVHLAQKESERFNDGKRSRNYAFGKFISEELESIQDKEILEDAKWDIQMTIRNALKQDRKRSQCNTSFQSIENRLILPPSPSQSSSSACFNNTGVKHEMSEEEV